MPWGALGRRCQSPCQKAAGEKPLQAWMGWVVALGVPRDGRIKKGRMNPASLLFAAF